MSATNRSGDREWVVTAELAVRVSGEDAFDAVPVIHDVLVSCGVPEALRERGRTVRVTYDSTAVIPPED